MNLRPSFFKILLTLALATSARATLAADSFPSNNLLARTAAQVNDVADQFPGTHAVPDDALITPESAKDRTQFNPLRMIKLGYVSAEYLVGYANESKVKAFLGGQFEPVLQDFGNGRKGAPIFISASVNKNFRGCSCPSQFREFTITTLVRDPGVENPQSLTPYATHVVSLYFATDHLKRQESMVHKFSVLEQFLGLRINSHDKPHIRFLGFQNYGKGFEIRNQTGDVIFSAERKSGRVPASEVVLPMADYIFYGRANAGFHFEGQKKFDLFNLEGYVTPGQYFRVQEVNHRMGVNPIKGPELADLFAPTDHLEYDTQSQPGKILQLIEYQPAFWSSEKFEGAIAWTPKPLPTY